MGEDSGQSWSFRRPVCPATHGSGEKSRSAERKDILRTELRRAPGADPRRRTRRDLQEVVHQPLQRLWRQRAVDARDAVLQQLCVQRGPICRGVEGPGLHALDVGDVHGPVEVRRQGLGTGNDLAELAPTFAEVGPNSGEIWGPSWPIPSPESGAKSLSVPNSGRSRSYEFPGPTLTETAGATSTDAIQIRPTSCKPGTNPADVMLDGIPSEIGQTWSAIGPVWPDFGRC